jgi:hypothetical protein
MQGILNEQEEKICPDEDKQKIQFTQIEVYPGEKTFHTVGLWMVAV